MRAHFGIGGFPCALTKLPVQTNRSGLGSARGLRAKNRIVPSLPYHENRALPAGFSGCTQAAHYHAQTWNAAELARALAVNESTVRRYLDLLTGVFLVRQLPPWFENLGKRQVRAPKVYQLEERVEVVPLAELVAQSPGPSRSRKRVG